MTGADGISHPSAGPVWGERRVEDIPGLFHDRSRRELEETVRLRIQGENVPSLFKREDRNSSLKSIGRERCEDGGVST